MKKFQRKIEDFVCEHCGTKVLGDGFTNHCPQCLWSKHVDIHPGDRKAPCQGLMEPVEFSSSSGEGKVLHRCFSCGFQKKNKIADNDNFAALIKVAEKRALEEKI